MGEHFRSLIPLMEEKSAITDAGKFHAAVNVIFHDIESKDYDELHGEMWDSLGLQYELLYADLENFFNERSGLKLLDVGCGTGLATDMLLKTKAGSKIDEVNLLDTSANMLELAKKRSATWGKKIKTIKGTIDQATGGYDIILISSVLHHIPDLPGFLHHVMRVQNSGGVLITIQDPVSLSSLTDIYQKRVKEYQDHSIGRPMANKRPMGERIANKLKRTFRIPTYIDKVNDRLLKENIIKQPLTETEIWSVTDIHIEGLPYSIGKGIGKESLARNLSQYSLTSYRTYGFFGMLMSNLDKQYRQMEKELAADNDQHGRYFCSAWTRNKS
jgi:ubiquinone/menaquinone biosynthesis C-methylase UbiE